MQSIFTLLRFFENVAWKLQAPTYVGWFFFGLWFFLFFFFNRRASRVDFLVLHKIYKQCDTYYSWSTFRKLLLSICYMCSIASGSFPSRYHWFVPNFCGTACHLTLSAYFRLCGVCVYKQLLFTSSWKTCLIKALLWPRQLWFLNSGHSCPCLTLQKLAVWTCCLA